MSLTFPLITASIAAGSILAAFWMSPFEPTIDGLSDRLDDIKESIDNTKAVNKLAGALKRQATRLMKQYDIDRNDILQQSNQNETMVKKRMLAVVKNATILKTLYENLLRSRDLHEIVHKSHMRVHEASGDPDAEGNPVGVKGLNGIRAWVLGGMKADLESDA